MVVIVEGNNELNVSLKPILVEPAIEVNRETAFWDKDTYKPGEIATLTVTVKNPTSVALTYDAVARNIVRTYWRKKYRERRRFCRLYEGDKGEWIADGRKLIAPAPNIEDIIDARALLKTLPERMVKAGIIRDEGGKLNNADKLYLCRQRHRISKLNWADAEKIERMRQLYVDEGLNCTEVAKIVGKGRSTVQNQLNKLGVIRH